MERVGGMGSVGVAARTLFSHAHLGLDPSLFVARGEEVQGEQAAFRERVRARFAGRGLADLLVEDVDKFIALAAGPGLLGMAGDMVGLVHLLTCTCTSSSHTPAPPPHLHLLLTSSSPAPAPPPHLYLLLTCTCASSLYAPAPTPCTCTCTSPCRWCRWRVTRTCSSCTPPPPWSCSSPSPGPRTYRSAPNPRHQCRDES